MPKYVLFKLQQTYHQDFKGLFNKSTVASVIKQIENMDTIMPIACIELATILIKSPINTNLFQMISS
jgi:hypothetical protein